MTENMVPSSLDAWDDLCLNPHSDQQQNGRTQGQYDGSISGYYEGYNIGLTTALSHGMEIGFIHGVLSSLKEHDLSTIVTDDEKLLRAQKSIQSLEKLLDEFPAPEDIIHDVMNVTSTTTTLHHDANVDGNGNSSTIDIANHMQQIQARFKIVMVQIGLSNVSLKQLMNTRTITSAPNTTTKKESSNMDNNTSEW
jgi:hypothetical protein